MKKSDFRGCAFLTSKQWTALADWCDKNWDFITHKHREQVRENAQKDKPIAKKLIDTNSIEEAIKLASQYK